MAETQERIYVIPLRRVWVETPRVRRANKSVSTVKEFIARHMHADEVKISEGVNRMLWAKGAKKPPAKIRVRARLDGAKATVTLPDEALAAEKPEEKKAATPMEKAMGLLRHPGGKEKADAGPKTPSGKPEAAGPEKAAKGAKPPTEGGEAGARADGKEEKGK